MSVLPQALAALSRLHEFCGQEQAASQDWISHLVADVPYQERVTSAIWQCSEWERE